MTQEESSVANDRDNQAWIANESTWKFVNEPFRRRHQYACSLYFSLYISYDADKGNLFNNQELLHSCDLKA